MITRFLVFVSLLSIPTTIGMLGRSDKDDKCIISEAEDCSISTFRNDRFTLVYPGGEARCFESTPENPNPYFFQVGPGRGDDANKLHIFFQGGSSCPTTEACLDDSDNQPRRSPYVNRGGIFDFEPDSKNPLRDWTQVSILYCSGDTHLGDGVLDGVYWKGRNNVRAVRDWIVDNIPRPDRVVLNGCSSGALGLFYYARSFLQYFKSVGTPSHGLTVVLDAMTGRSEVEPSLLWNHCSREDYGWTEEQYQRCLIGNFTRTQVMEATQAAHRDVPFVFFLYKNDAFLNQQTCECSQAEFYGQHKKALRRYTELAGSQNNIVSYIINGNFHCLFEFLPDRFFFTRSAVGEPSATEFVEMLVTRDGNATIRSSCVPRLNMLSARNRSIDFGCDDLLKNAVFHG
mmetsp:Transcript_30738/g.47081  ORF Transcript_30738/g.47081 Transcript_30738/m.47081 type:complete len:400 (+) Transcript_30738:96-1295(+)